MYFVVLCGKEIMFYLCFCFNNRMTRNLFLVLFLLLCLVVSLPMERSWFRRFESGSQSILFEAFKVLTMVTDKVRLRTGAVYR